MKSLIKSLVVATLLLAGGATLAAAELGKDYRLLKAVQPTSTGNKVEVLEFFFYGCSHCYHLHPKLTEWEKAMPKDVELIYVPTIYRESMEPLGRAFFALESLGQDRQLHDALYRAMNVENMDLHDEATIGDFVARNGVDRARFSAAYNSFSMQSKVSRVKQMIRSYGISGTPTLVVDGKYLITELQPDDTIRVLKEVVAMARQARSGKK